MSYLDRLKGDQFPKNCPTELLTKLTEAPFVSSVSTRVGQKKASDHLSQQDHEPAVLWWRVSITQPGGRTVEVDAPSGWSLADWQAYAARYHGPGCTVTALLPLPKPWAPVNLDEVLAAACDGQGISPEVLRSLLSPEDLDDIAAGDLPLGTVQAFEQAAIAREAARAPNPHPLALPRLPPISEGRRQRVLAILGHEGGQYAVAVDTPWRRADPVILVLATPQIVQNLAPFLGWAFPAPAGTCELHLPRDRFDLPAVMKMVAGWNTADPCGERGEVGEGNPLGGQEGRLGDHPLLVKPETEPQFRAWSWQSNRYDPKGRCGGTYLAPASDDIDTVRAYLEKFFGVQLTELRSNTTSPPGGGEDGGDAGADTGQESEFRFWNPLTPARHRQESLPPRAGARQAPRGHIVVRQGDFTGEPEVKA